jgi:hypothetical protein
LKIRKKAKFKKVYWLLIDLAVVAVILILLLYRPARYRPSEPARDKQVSPYLTHELLPQLYNGIQRREPFDLVVIQQGINDAITRSKWPKESEGIRFSAPKVLFVPESITLMGTAVVGGVELVITIVVEPLLDDGGLLNLHVAKIKVGAMNITPLARIIARKMYAQRLAAADVDTETLRARIAASLLNNEPFEPVFEIEDKKVRAKKISITHQKLTIRLTPAS